jgi:hypothetical protein
MKNDRRSSNKHWEIAMTNDINAAATVGQVRELTVQELDLVSGGFDLGPVHIEAGQGMVTVGVGGYGVWAGNGCVGVYTPDSVKGVCVK